MKKTMLRVAGLLGPLFIATTALAQGGAASNASDVAMWKVLAAALAIGVAAFGGALGQGKAAAAALEGIARNPNASGKIFTPLILGLALIESLVIYGFVVSLTILLQ